jgi:hypothetical protein
MPLRKRLGHPLFLRDAKRCHMPNGDDKNLMRVYEVVNGFRRKHGRWPTTIRLPEISCDDLLNHVLTDDGRAAIRAKLDFVVDEDEFCALDAGGAKYEYLSGRSEPPQGEASAAEWLGVDHLTRHGADYAESYLSSDERPRRISVICADIGSQARGRFGWAHLRAESLVGGGTELGGLATAVAGELNRGVPVSMGFECPLFVPITTDPAHLTKARTGEGSRAWCAGAGAGALATGLSQVVWILERIRQELRQPCACTLNWDDFSAGGADLFIWEAFVSGDSKGALHTDDAELGARAFRAALPEPSGSNAIAPDVVHSLIGAALLRTGWSTDLALLETPCLVIRP